MSITEILRKQFDSAGVGQIEISKNMTCSILGAEYEIIEKLLEENDGVCNFYDKTIMIRPISGMLDETHPIHEKKSRYEEVLRHELIHAFLYESGADEYARDEQLVDILSIQFPKIICVMDELSIL